jgi:DNA-binding NarL/FixJ family response regulator
VLNKQRQWLTENWCKIVASHKCRDTYPESIDLDLHELLTKPREIRVSIIDDHPFPWTGAIENRGCIVNYYSDYTKPITQANQKIKTISVHGSDIIVCDINGVGSSIYPNLDGIGVIEELRQKHPLHVIVAYTGNPGAIHTKLRKKDALDGILSRDLSIDDFLFNFEELLKIFRSPKSRWQFLQARLRYLGLKEKEIDIVRRKYVENVLLSKMLKHKTKNSAAQTIEIISKDSGASVGLLTRIGLSAAQVTSVLSPFVLGN